MMRQFELVERVRSYDPDVDEDAINRAYVYATKMHGVQKRASGDPYFSHPIEVAGILTNYKLDTASIVTALLHDVVEDTAATLDEVREMFGEEVARLVDGVTKLARIQIQNIENKQAENFRKFVLAMSEDIRVLLVKLADRLHNMRTLHFIADAAKRRAIAMETMEIYAPLAERIGMQEIKTELEDLAFAEMHSEARASILTRLRFLELHGGDLVVKIMDELDQVMRKVGIEGYISGREKTPYSIWRKMQIKDVSFEQLSDIMAFRIMVDNIADCYRVLGIVHTAYPTVPGRFKDYISTPKRNGYRSIHTSVIGPEKHRIEIQIRTHQMHEVGELGVAAHWKYKSSDLFEGETLKPVEGRQYSWLRELLDILEHAQSPQEFLGTYQARDVPGSGVLLHAQGRSDCSAARRKPGGLRLCRPHRGGQHLRRRQGQRPHRALAHAAAERRSGGNRHVLGAEAVARMGRLRRHRQGARAHSPPHPCRGPHRIHQARP